ncbi:hypothetical protein C2S51_009003 [Perilla frutescens var. frutescens]|nr:hypothetical protein C2S51_009003 [Perilla frutescens var. frutescens]
MVGMNLEVGVDENRVFLEKLQLVSIENKLVCREMNEAIVDEDSTLEKDSTMKENSMNIPTKESLVCQTKKVFDEMTEEETKLWHEGYRESIDHTRKLTDMDDFGKISCDSHSIKHLSLMKSLSCLLPEPPPSQICYKDHSKSKSYKLFTHQNMTFMCSSTFSIGKICHKDKELDGELLKSSVQLVSYENEVAIRVEQTNPTPKILQRFKALLDIAKEHNVIGVKSNSEDPYRTLGTILELDISNGEVHKVA